jgi:hypothetical protein
VVTVLAPSPTNDDEGAIPMSNLERRWSRRHRTRNLIAVSVMWAGVGSLVVTDQPAAAAPAATNVVDGPSTVGTPSARALALLKVAPVTVHGVTDDARALDGTFTLRRFRQHQGVLYAVGRLTGTLGGAPVSQTVQLPITSASNDAPGAQGLAQPVPTPGACSILTLALGPLDLDLLGLRVALDEVNLLVEAIPGAGNLLGNLLCAVAGLLNGGLGGGLGALLNNLLAAIADLLNGLLGV